MVQRGSPEEYFGTTQQVVIQEPLPLVKAKMVEPVEVQPIQTQLQTTDHTPLVICVCFLGTVCFLAFLAWSWKK